MASHLIHFFLSLSLPIDSKCGPLVIPPATIDLLIEQQEGAPSRELAPGRGCGLDAEARVKAAEPAQHSCILCRAELCGCPGHLAVPKVKDGGRKRTCHCCQTSAWSLLTVGSTHQEQNQKCCHLAPAPTTTTTWTQGSIKLTLFQAFHLIKAVSVLLNFSQEEENMLKETLEYKVGFPGLLSNFTTCS